MPFVKIDNTEFEVPSDRTVLEVALDNNNEVFQYRYLKRPLIQS
jgi:hypothetical protein